MKSNFKETFFSFISRLPIAAFVADSHGRILASNQLWLETTGFLEDEIHSLEQLDDLLSQKITPIWKKIFHSKQPANTDISIIHKANFKLTHLKLTVTLFEDNYAFFSAVDITDQINLHDTLQDKQNQMFSLINSLGDVVFKTNLKGKILKIWTVNFSDYFPGISFNEKTNLFSSFPERVANAFSNGMQASVLDERSQLTEVEFSYTYEGKDRYYVAKIAPIQAAIPLETDEFIFIVREITEEKKFKHQVKYKNRLIKQLTSIRNGPLLHVVEGDPMTFKFISGDSSSLTGQPDKELSEMKWLDMIHYNDRESVLNNLQEFRSNHTVLHKDLIYRIINSNGDLHWVNNQISRVTDGGEDTLIGVILDVTEIQLLNDKLRQRERILTNASKVAKIGGWEYDFINKRFNLTEEIYQIHERSQSEYDAPKSLDYFSDEHQPLFRKHFNDLIEKGEAFDDELQIVTGKGNKKWVRVVGCAEWNNGQITHIYGVIQDIDKRKSQELILQENEKRFNTAFERAPLGIGLFSPERNWIKVNPSLCEFFELSNAELVQTPIENLDFVDASNRPSDWEQLTRTNKPIYQLEKKYRTVDGKIKWGRISLSQVYKEDGALSYFIIQVVDITENKQYEENLIIAKKEAEKANRIKSDFLSTMTHEIRTPLYGVIGLTNLLLEEIQDPKYNDHLKALKFSSESLFLLVNDILDFSKIKSGALLLEQKTFNLKRLVESIEELAYVRSQEGGNTIVLHYDANLSDQYVGDELRIGQILNNLVSNAVKFTSNGLIEIKVEYLGELDLKHRILFSIKDNGIGISEDIQPFVFDQFIQAEAGTTRKYGGTGLGLSIVKGLTEAMGSDIKLFSELGKGTEVCFELRLGKPRPDSNPYPPKIGDEQRKNLQEKTLLLVEDNPISMMVTQEYIKRWNGNIIQAVNGEEAVKKFKQNKHIIDLVLMDLQIPILNGFEAAEQIRKSHPKIPIIALTASLDEVEFCESGRSIMQGFLIKPYVPDELYYMLKEHLE